MVDECSGGVESDSDGWIIISGKCEYEEKFDGYCDELSEFCWRVTKSNTNQKWQVESESIVYY